MRSYFMILVGCFLAEVAANAFDNGKEAIIKGMDSSSVLKHNETSDSRTHQGEIENPSSGEDHQPFTPNDDDFEDDSDDASDTQSSVPRVFSAPESEVSSMGFFTKPENEDFDDGSTDYYNSNYPQAGFWNDSIYRIAGSVNGGFKSGGPKHDNSTGEKYMPLLRGGLFKGIVMKRNFHYRFPTRQHRELQRNKPTKETNSRNSGRTVKDPGKVRGKEKDHSREFDASRFNSSLWSEFKEIEMARLSVKNFFTRLREFIVGPQFQLEAFLVDADDMEDQLGRITKWVNDLGQQQYLLHQVRFLHFMLQDMRACAEKLSTYGKNPMEGCMYVTRIISLRALLFQMYNIDGKLDKMNNWFAGKLFGYWVSVQVWRNNLEVLEDTPDFLWNDFEIERLTVESRFTALGRQFPNFDYPVL